LLELGMKNKAMSGYGDNPFGEKENPLETKFESA